MPDRGELAAIALRYDTALSRAMLRALGLSFAYRRMVMPHRRQTTLVPTCTAYDGLRECMRNGGRFGPRYRGR